MKRLVTAILILCLMSVQNLNAQSSLSFYQLGGTTFQNSNYNPAHLPAGKVFFGLPVLSGVHINYNNRLAYKDVIAINPETGNPKIYPEIGLSQMRKNNLISVHSNISLFHVGFRAENGMTFSAFANERIEADVFFTQQTMKLFVRGNNSLIDQRVEVGKNRSHISHFREIGLGFSYPSPSLPVTLGARIKYLQGFTNVSTSGTQSAYVSTDSESRLIQGELDGSMLRTSGLDLMGTGSHYGFNSNVGLALDLGFVWEMDRYNEISASIVDIGYISWKENVENRTLRDTTFTYGGVPLDDLGNIRKTVMDSLVGNFKTDENRDPYTTLLGTKLFATWVYHTPYPGGDVVTSLGTRYLQGKMNTMMGVGYRQRFGGWFVGSVNLTKLPQQFFNIGSSFAIKGGPVQFYMAADQIVNFDLTNFKAFDFRFGINFILDERGGKGVSGNSSATSYDKNKNDTKRRGPGFSQSQSFMGSKVKVKRQEGIYNIIPKQGRRKKEEYFPNESPE